MRSKAVLVTLALSFIAPVFLFAADTARADTARVSSTDGACRGKRAKKSDGDSSKAKKKDKDGKKSYGFEL
jgi:hypothetical protein